MLKVAQAEELWWPALHMACRLLPSGRAGGSRWAV